MDRVVVTREFNGICSMQVCALKDATDDEILETCNDRNPSGTSNGWSRVVRDDPEHPNRNPVVCGDDPGRVHLLVDC